MKINNTLIIISVGLLSLSCHSHYNPYQTNPIGPDRYVITYRGENIGQPLIQAALKAQAYYYCTSHGYHDIKFFNGSALEQTDGQNFIVGGGSNLVYGRSDKRTRSEGMIEFSCLTSLLEYK